MSQRSPGLQTADAPLRPPLVVGWSLFFVFVFIGLGAAFWIGRSAPVLLDALVP